MKALACRQCEVGTRSSSHIVHHTGTTPAAPKSLTPAVLARHGTKPLEVGSSFFDLAGSENDDKITYCIVKKAGRMARPREFDTDEVLGVALEVFWEKGYRSTSYVDLEAATGVKKASLVAAYGDKHALFVAAVERYLSQVQVLLKDLFSDARSPSRAIEKWASLMVEGAASRGCLATNTSIEMAETDREVAGLLKKYMRLTESKFSELIQAGIDAGEFRKDTQPAVAAKYLLAFTNGLNVMGKGGVPKKDLIRVTEMTLKSMR